MMDMKAALTDRAYAAGWRLVRGLPENTARRVFDTGGTWAGRRANRAAHRGAPNQLRRNLSRVLGVAPAAVPDELITASMRSYARYWREAFRLPSMDHAAITAPDRMPPVQNIERLDVALAAGRGGIFVLPHSGNWDMAGLWLVQHYGTFSTVAERLRPESLFRRFVSYRESLGFEVFPLTGGEQPPFAQLAERLRANQVICLLGERDLTGKGVPVNFFGERTWMPAGAAKLAVDTGAALLPVHAWFTEVDDREGWAVKVDPEVDVSGGIEAATQTLADRFAANIAEHPADWHMLQPLWESDLSAERRARIATAQAQRTPSPRNPADIAGDEQR
ncbi:Phosphatidylinositol mannoside acyltransferase [Nocardia sp. RB56]|uniref:Phosphatidylinositol mannoside acyltransferase n=2 Tax=Nocardia aurantia TaxID=2585199 RepID=A0A7K0DT52_9NOCA|nr:phosphatidylinositol mannoside acyltransferase [Nocardia aurantia]MQY28949.1 Phosphatidylinositol mannoside acyltransferase [Nocardia aurantia]